MSDDDPILSLWPRVSTTTFNCTFFLNHAPTLSPPLNANNVRLDGSSVAQFWDENRDTYNVAGHEDDEPFKEAFWLRILNSLCDPG